MDEAQAPDLPSMNSPDDDVGGRIKAAREERGFTQSAVATRTKMIDPEKKGISRTALIGYEQGTSKPGLREIRLLCDVLHISPNQMIYGTASAAVATQASLEFLGKTPDRQLDDVIVTALAMTVLKGHERDALQSLALSLAGRQLGDLKLSSLLGTAWFVRDAFWSALKDFSSEISEVTTLEELAQYLIKNGAYSNAGNRFRFDEDGQLLNPKSALYPDPDSN